MDEAKFLSESNGSDLSQPKSHKSFRRKSVGALYSASEELWACIHRRCCRVLTKSRALLLVMSVVSVTIVLLAQSFLWDGSPVVQMCCGGSVAGSGAEKERRKLVTSLSVWDKRKKEKNGLNEDENSILSESEYRKDLAEALFQSDDLNTDEIDQVNSTYDDVGNDTDVRQRLPQCIIIGVRKGGTRALLEFLSLHPQIATNRAEVHFFDNEENYSQGLEWYRTSMTRSTPDQITMEKTPAYFVSEAVPERIYAMNRSIKLLLIVRDPVERAISDYDQIRIKNERHFKPDVSFEELAIREKSGRVNDGYAAIRRGVYHRYMLRWLRYFRPDQFHLVSGERLVKEPLPELRKIETFLNLPSRLNEDMFYLNKTRGFYCMRNIDGQQERCLARSKGREHPYVSPECIEKLRRYYQPHNARFYRMVGIDFGWP